MKWDVLRDVDNNLSLTWNAASTQHTKSGFFLMYHCAFPSVAADMKSLFFPCFCFTLENIQLRKVEFSELKPFALAEVEDL